MNEKARINRLTIQLSNNLSSLFLLPVAEALLEDEELEIFDHAMEIEDWRLEVL